MFNAMAYQIGREIRAYKAVLCIEDDSIIITGGLAYSKRLIGYVKEMVKFIALFKLYKVRMKPLL